MKKVILRSLLLFLITVILFYFILKDNFYESVDLLSKSNLLFIVFAMFFYALYIISEAYLLKMLINRSDKKYTIKKSIELTLMTRFFNGITPFSLGGEPLQVYELSKENIKVSDSILAITEAFIIHEITVTFLTIIAIILKYVFNLIPSGFLWSMTLIGFLVNFIIIFVVSFICIKINVAKKIGTILIKILGKIHLIKDVDSSIKGWNDKCIEYSKGYKALLKDKTFMFKSIMVNSISMIAYYCIAYFAIISVASDININFMYSLILSTLIYISATFVPIPGGSVGIEYAYLNYYILIADENIVVVSLLLWRFISFYLPMIVGGILFNIIDNKRSLECKEVDKN